MSLPDVPVLETERLVLRGHRPQDFKDCLAMWADPEVVRYISGKPQTAEEVWAKMLRMVGHWSVLGYGFWVVSEKATGRFVGEAGFGRFKRDFEPGFGDDPEVGWGLASWAHGKGYAGEAVRAALAWGERRFDGARMVCMIAPENTPSLRLAGKLGFREYGRATYKDQPTLLLERNGSAGNSATTVSG